MGRALRHGAALALGLALPLQAQVVRGTLTEAGSGLPLEGAVVALLTTGSDSVRTSVLTDAEGTFRLDAAPGRWLLRAELIGHRTVRSDPFEVGVDDLVIALSASVEAVSLEGVDVTAPESRRCLVRPSEASGLGTARAWEQARKALESSFVAQETEAARFDGLLYERDLDASSLGVVEERSRPYRASGSTPFRSASPGALAERGFVQTTDSGTFYYAPDERVLLSEAFLAGHCFRLGESEEEGRQDLVGLRFEPIRGSSRPDIEGVMWLDRSNAELRSLEFHYVNLRVAVPTDRLGGGIRFQRLPSGAWIPRRWWIRMPMIELQRTRILGRERQRTVLAGIREQGGEVLAVESGGVRLEQLDRPRVQGTVFDSTRSLPLVGAEVFLAGTTHTTRTDRYGRFVLVAAEGDFDLSFRHERVDALGYRPEPRRVSLRPEVVLTARLAVPSQESLLVRRCGESPGPTVAGSVRGADAEPLPGALVRLGWPASESPEGWREERTDSAGAFVFCGAPRGTRVVVRATRAGLTSEPRTVRVDDRVAWVELSVDTLRTAQVAGLVSDASDGRPLAAVAVRVAATGQRGVTDRNGAFVLADVPPGAQTLEFEHLLYGVQARGVDVPAGASLSLGVALAAGVIELEPLTVTVESVPLPGARGFEARRTSGVGFFLNEEQIARMQPLQMTDLFNAVPGLTVACGDPNVFGSGCRVQFERARALDPRGGERACPIQYFLDGSSASAAIVQSLRPQSIRGIEVYNGLSEVPPELRRGPDTRCGVIAVWLKARR